MRHLFWFKGIVYTACEKPRKVFIIENVPFPLSVLQWEWVSMETAKPTMASTK